MTMFPLPIVYIFQITSTVVPPGTCWASQNASPGAKYPIAALSVCICLITQEITAFCLSAFLSEISLFWQAVDRAALLLCVDCVCMAERTCLTLFWTSSTFEPSLICWQMGSWHFTSWKGHISGILHALSYWMNEWIDEWMNIFSFMLEIILKYFE